MTRSTLDIVLKNKTDSSNAYAHVTGLDLNRNNAVYLLQADGNPGPAVVEPSATNPSDVNYNLNWGFCEFTFNSFQLFVNISYVDFVSIPVSLALENDSGVLINVPGLPSNGLDTVCDSLRAQDARDNAGWSKLVVRTPDNKAKT
ncbi:glucanase b [Colletotrichum plurivorum]|uniref:Glucanase b n=1 Tax=Colletotrichum plurivorum TaxID=2175906 RepID=A0A8H6NKQ4_9PEZI|nr:glucanase b [Colletotrichum plurivorum]